MKSIRYILLLLTLALLNTTCEKLGGPAKNIYQTWEVKDFISVESIAYDKNARNQILLTINTDNTYSLKLDVNSCSGALLSISELGIAFGSPTCTEACCDSDFSRKFVELLPLINMYKVDGNTLRLSIPDWGFIECERIED